MTESQIKAILDKALEFRARGALPAAVRTIQPLLKAAPQTASVAGILGTIFFESEDWPQAARWFAAAVELNPASERASLGLFHSLWAMDRRREALSEMARFRSSQVSPEYDNLHREMTEEFLEYMAYMNGVKRLGRLRSRSVPWRNGRNAGKLKEAPASLR